MKLSPVKRRRHVISWVTIFVLCLVGAVGCDPGSGAMGNDAGSSDAARAEDAGRTVLDDDAGRDEDTGTGDDRDAGDQPDANADAGDEPDASADAGQTGGGPCTPSPCRNGTCTAAGRGYFCECADGYTGQTCSVDIDECERRPCRNNGTCTDGVAGFTCACPTGFTGTACENDINDCPSPDPCMNGGTCLDRTAGYTCRCAMGFGGDDCAQSCGATITAAATGSFSSPATWVGGVVPTGAQSILIPPGITVTVPAGMDVRTLSCANLCVRGTLENLGTLTVDGTVQVMGPNPATAGTVSNSGTFILRGDLLSTAAASGLAVLANAQGATFTFLGSRLEYNRFRNEGTFEIGPGAAMYCTTSTSCSFSSSGTLTVRDRGILDVRLPAFEVAVNAGTLVNEGTFRPSNFFENSGTIISSGSMSLSRTQPAGSSRTRVSSSSTAR